MYLLDTHTLLWFLKDSPKLSNRALEIITTENEIFFSIVSLWEIVIKKSIGKLDLTSSIQEIEDLYYEKDVSLLQIKSKHLDKIMELPNIHNDPFDRLIISQSIIENLILITKDSNIPYYPVKTVW
ncbi:type II toxin-antitoxin system VapC family toxin [Treponema denticola]|uniref:type II toxin-antitoxin system VapC family toxin n=1 Tax=Treponema denticola TaxID=158 RepID=UPI0002B4F89C|nr:type II toxin-antitoxin system VapC family toxin [Treponema denticola]EMB43491.1 hypothetical protein HMPREF9730_02304 [Treponema denticola AL-2]